MQTLLTVIKSIFCVQEFNNNCNKCSLCHLIDDNIFPNLKIIEPDGLMIKKGQIIDLKNSFAMSSQIAKNKIYVIKNCEKMNKESGNTILKFLEEPEDDIYGFFITSNIDSIMPTIKSRCQIINDIYDDNSLNKLNISKDKKDNYLNIIYNYLYDLEVKKADLILINKKYLNEFEKDDIINIFKIIIDIYIKYIDNKYENYKEYNFLNKYSRDTLRKKLLIIINTLDHLNYNVNLDLLLDRFVIEMDGVKNESI